MPMEWMNKWMNEWMVYLYSTARFLDAKTFPAKCLPEGT
jgi:hypothetical protein